MRYSICPCLITLVNLTITGLATGNENTKLAMHLIATSDSLACDDLVPADCDSINVDLSSKEVLDSDGYGYVVFLAFDADSLSGAEFAVDGWPTGRGAPPKQGPYWCADNPLSLGNIFGDGGITAFGECVDPGVDGLVPLGYIFFGPLDENDFPIDLSYEASTYSYPDSGHNYVLGCAPGFIEYGVASHSGCTIGGTYADSLPSCPAREGGGEDGGGEEELHTPQVEFLGPRVQRARSSGSWVNLKGQHVDERTRVSIRSPIGGTRSARSVFLGDGIFVFKAATAEADTGLWSVVVSNGIGKTVTLHSIMHLVPSLVKYRAARCGNDYLPGVVSVKLRDGVLELPANSDASSPAQATIESDALAYILADHSISSIERIFKGRSPGPTLSQDVNGNPIWLDDLSQFYLLRLPMNVDAADVATDLEIRPEVKQVWLNRPGVDFVDTYEPNDPYYADSTQWAPRKIACPEAWGRDTCSTEIRISIIDRGTYYGHEDLGASTDSLDFPNSKIVGGYNFWNKNEYPWEFNDPQNNHGTLVAGVAAAETNNGIGMAGVGWNAKLLAYRCHPDSVGQKARAVAQSLDDGAEITNMSWGYYGCEHSGVPESDFADLKAAAHQTHRAGITLVASAGNNFSMGDPCPANYEWVVAVAAVNSADRYMPLHNHGSYIDVAGPTNVFTTADEDSNSYRTSFGGTSAAAPHVAGAVSLLHGYSMSLFDSLHYGEDIRGLICAAADTATSPAGHTYPNIYVGWGRINVSKAMARLEEPYNGGEGPSHLSTSGVDCHFPDGVSFWSSDSTTEYVRYCCRKWATFDGVYADSFAWGMHRFDTNGAPPSAADEDEMGWPYCEVIPTTVASWGCSLESFVYLKIVQGDSTEADTSWVPCSPQIARLELWSLGCAAVRSSGAAAEPHPSDGDGAELSKSIQSLGYNLVLGDLGGACSFENLRHLRTSGAHARRGITSSGVA